MQALGKTSQPGDTGQPEAYQPSGRRRRPRGTRSSRRHASPGEVARTRAARDTWQPVAYQSR
eukprot:10646755-Alexandrium_andersonii.AAC.1